jgi:hypothetical protein
MMDLHCCRSSFVLHGQIREVDGNEERENGTFGDFRVDRYLTAKQLSDPSAYE